MPREKLPESKSGRLLKAAADLALGNEVLKKAATENYRKHANHKQVGRKR